MAELAQATGRHLNDAPLGGGLAFHGHSRKGAAVSASPSEDGGGALARGPASHAQQRGLPLFDARRPSSASSHSVCAETLVPFPDLKLHTMRSATVVLAALVALQLLTPAASGTSCAASGSGGPCGWPNKAVTHPKRLLLPAADLKDAITWPLDQSSLDAYCAGVCGANGTTFDYSSKAERLAAPWLHWLLPSALARPCGAAAPQ